MSITVPTRMLTLDGETVVLRGDFSAIYTLEEVAGMSIFDLVSRFQARQDYRIIAQMLFAFSASHREAAGGGSRDEDPTAAFRAWMKDRPVLPVDDFWRTCDLVFSLLIDAVAGGRKNGSTPAEAPAAQDAPQVEPPSPSTGDGSSTAPPFSGDAPSPTSGE